MSKKEKDSVKEQPPKDPKAIAQPNPDAKDKQGYIRENAQKGQSVPVPNTVGPNAVSGAIEEEEEKEEKK